MKDKAILELKNTRDRLKKYRKKLDQETLKLNEQAVMHVQAKQKSRALLVLKLKKHKINEADNIDKQLFSVYEMIDTIEWESINIKVDTNCFCFFWHHCLIVTSILLGNWSIKIRNKCS